MRRNSGIWPPSKPRRTPPPARAFCPLCPLPAVFPCPEPTPRPSLLLFFVAPFGTRMSKPSMSADLLDVQQVRHGAHHPEDGRRRVVLDHSIEPAKTQCLHRCPVGRHAADGAARQRDPQLLYRHCAHPHMSFRVRPRFAAMTRGSMRDPRPWKTAFTVLIAFEDPSDFERMSWIPAASITART